jgi:hypothetical protein
VQSLLSNSLPHLIRDIAVESRHSQMPRVELQELARRRIDAPNEILEWAMRDRRWSFTLAELLSDPISRPRDLAARLVVAIIDELEQERELLGADTPETSAQLSGNVHAELRAE